MLGGGIADKLGNEFELRWTLLEFIRVLIGRADEIRLEPYNENAEGFEFRVNISGNSEWHQCKRRRASGSWTLRSLSTEGVLQAFSGKLVHVNNICVFVSSDPAPAFETLIEKASLAETSDDFYGEGGIGKGDRVALKELNEAWAVDLQTSFEWLKRCRVEVTSDRTLQRRLDEMSSMLFKTPSDLVVERLSGVVNSNFGRRLNRDDLVRIVGEVGIEWLAYLESTIDERFRTATEDYLASLSPKVGGIDLPIPDFEKIVDTAIADEKLITVIAGSAGSGKSVVLSQIIAEARKHGWPVLAFRIDRYLETQTLDSLGRELLGHDGSPVGSLGGRYAAVPSLLVIDQVDAVSEASGRSGRMRDLLFRMIDQSQYFQRMRVVIACRSYDLDRDTRLEQLSKTSQVSLLRLQPLDWKDAIQPLLAKLDIDESTLTARSRQVLAIPINLQIFISIAETGDRAEGELSNSRLFDKLMDVRERALRQNGFTWTALEAMGSIAQLMNANQELTVPKSVIDKFSGAVDALNSMGLVTVVGRKLQFAHESFFDHTFSRHFITSGQSVRSLLTSDEQRLFRRTQVRQIFSRLRDHGDRSYLANLRDVVTADDVRYLVKDAVAYWLSDVDDPTDRELSIVAEWFSSGDQLNKLAHIIFNGRDWLPVLFANGTLQKLVQQEGEAKDFAFWLMTKSAVRYSSAVAAYLKDWWRVDQSGRTSQLVAWFGRLFPDGPIGELELLYADVITSMPPASFKEDFEANFELGTWVHKSKPLGARILGLWLRAWMARYPDQHPFGEGRNDSHQHWVRELAEKESKVFLDETIPAFAEALNRQRRALDSGALKYPTIRPPHYKHDQEYLRSIIHALEKCAIDDPRQAEAYLEILRDDSDTAIFIHLRAIAANGDGLHRLLVPMLGLDRLFKVGDGNGDWLPFAQAATAAMPYLNFYGRTRVENAVMAYRPEYDWAREYYRRFKTDELFQKPPTPNKNVIRILATTGCVERAILKSIGHDLLSDKARRRLEELERKFRDEPLPEAYGIRGGWVRSPISPDQARFMSDRQWVSAMQKYAADGDRSYKADGVIGGIRELSSILQGRVKEEPVRFIELLEKMSISLNSDYAEAMINGLQESEVDGFLVARAIKAALRWSEGNFRRVVSWTVRQHPSSALDSEILAYLISAAEEGLASDDIVKTIKSDNENKIKIAAADLLAEDEDLWSSGINGERGAAYEALATVLWNHEEILPEILDLIERQVRTEPLASVRICMVHAINSVGKYEPDCAVRLFQKNAEFDQRILIGNPSLHMINWVVNRNPEVVVQLARTLTMSEHRNLLATGHFFESLLALLDDDQNRDFVAGFQRSSLRRQIAGYRAAANISSDHHGDRAVEWLLELFNDSEILVRKDAMVSDWEGVLSGEQDRSEFVRYFISSKSFEDNSDSLLRALEDRVSQFSELTFDAVDRVMEAFGGWTGENKQGHYFTFHHLSRVLIELYRSIEGGGPAERKILDLFDAYLSRDIYDMRNEISAYERH